MKTLSYLLLITMLGSSAALAQEKPDGEAGPIASDSKLNATADQPSNASGALPLGMQFLSFFYGPRIDDPSGGEVPTTFIDSPSGVSLQNELGVRYDVTDDLSIMPVFDFELLMSDPMGVYKDGQYAALSYDSFLKINQNNILNVPIGEHTLNLGADLRYYVPTSDFSRVNNSLGSLRLTVIPTVQFAHSNWSVSMVNFVRYFFQKQTYMTVDGTTALPRVMYYTGPLVNYQATDKVALWLLGEASVTYDTKGVANTTDRNRTLVDFEPGVDFHVGEHLTISPYLNWFTRMPLKSTTVNVTANLTI